MTALSLDDRVVHAGRAVDEVQEGMEALVGKALPDVPGSVRDTFGASPCWCDGHVHVAGRVGVGRAADPKVTLAAARVGCLCVGYVAAPVGAGPAHLPLA